MGGLNNQVVCCHAFPSKASFLKNWRVGKRKFSFHAFRRAMATFTTRMLQLLYKLKAVRCVALLTGFLNLVIIFLSGYIIIKVFPNCADGRSSSFLLVAIASAIKIISVVGTGLAQEATASTILSQHDGSSTSEASIRHERRLRYIRWLWWTRLGMFVNFLQLAAAAYLLFSVVKLSSYEDDPKGCFSGKDSSSRQQSTSIVISLVILVWMVVILHCFTGTDVLRWRSFYAKRDSAWKAHYHEVFDHGIREALCCMGRMKYLTVLEEDEVYSVAKLLGDLVAYRALGTGHLELLAGMALLQRHKEASYMPEGHREAPEHVIQEAVLYHPFAEAAYTGPLLDFGRNPILFPCAWFYRQGILTPWARNRRPVLEGDNWLRGHAAAFLRSVGISANALRKGRVSQVKREAAYFVVVLHHLRSVVIAVRGTESPEDLLTDGLCSECALSEMDMDGLMNRGNLTPEVISSSPHYAHSGIVEAARELFMQLDGEPADSWHPAPREESCSYNGFLSSLLGDGCECHGYNIRVVGHSLGGSIAALLGMRLYQRYRNLHVYSYGTLPCVDAVVGEACSSFVTSIIYNDEFSSRLSVNSILRLRAAAIRALSEDLVADSATICGLARRILLANKNQVECRQIRGVESDNLPSNQQSWYEGMSQQIQFQDSVIEPQFLSNYFCEPHGMPFSDATCNDARSCSRHASDIVSDFSSSLEESARYHPEMYLPGLLVHIIPEKKSVMPLWRSWMFFNKECTYRAYIADRANFQDIIISPYMFLDHLPWRCQLALESVLKTRITQDQVNPCLLNEIFMA